MIVTVHIPNVDTAGFEQCQALFRLIRAAAQEAADRASLGDGVVCSWELDALASRKAPSEGTVTCYCGAVSHWKGEPPEECLRCGELLVELAR